MDKIMMQKLLGIASGGLLVGGILFLLLSLAEQWHNVQTFLAAFSCIGLSCLFHILKRLVLCQDLVQVKMRFSSS